MTRAKAALGYLWAAASLAAVLSAAFALEPLGRAFVRGTGIKITPYITGGEIVKVKFHGPYRTLIHRPVFDGIFAARRRGLLRIDWEPAEALPPFLSEEIDVLGDGRFAFRIGLFTRTGGYRLISRSPELKEFSYISRTPTGWMIQIQLDRDLRKPLPTMP